MAARDWTPSRLRDAIDRGALRDKVVVGDPAAAPLGCDDEAAGIVSPGDDGANGEQARAAQRAVPALDYGRAVATAAPLAEQPIASAVRRGPLLGLAVLLGFTFGLVVLALHLTLPR